jgi:antitoxin component YwqK of YwqJK toxin-antitoxin module
MDGPSTPLTRLIMDGGIASRKRAVLLAFTLIVAGGAHAQTFAVQGTCRDGSPHGAWQLTDAAGHTRVLGAFNRGRRTGSFIFWDGNGVRIAHLPYEEDARNGTLALWHARGTAPEGPQRLEAVYAAGRLNGVVRAWDPSGRLRGEYRYAAGALTDAKAWDARGRELPPQEARAQAGKDASANESYLQTLESLVARHSRACGAPPPTTTSAPRPSGPRSGA